MTAHQLTQNNRILASGTRDEVWTFITRWYGHMTMRQFNDAGLVFEVAREKTAVDNVIQFPAEPGKAVGGDATSTASGHD